MPQHIRVTLLQGNKQNRSVNNIPFSGLSDVLKVIKIQYIHKQCQDCQSIPAPETSFLDVLHPKILSASLFLRNIQMQHYIFETHNNVYRCNGDVLLQSGADKTIGRDYTLAMYKMISFSMKLQKSS